MTQGTKKGSVQAADFLIKEARKLQTGKKLVQRRICRLSFDEAEALFL
jgi:hypothetical protein